MRISKFTSFLILFPLTWVPSYRAWKYAVTDRRERERKKTPIKMKKCGQPARPALSVHVYSFIHKVKSVDLFTSCIGCVCVCLSWRLVPRRRVRMQISGPSAAHLTTWHAGCRATPRFIATCVGRLSTWNTSPQFDHFGWGLSRYMKPFS